jgi:hypothetical protein
MKGEMTMTTTPGGQPDRPPAVAGTGVTPSGSAPAAVPPADDPDAIRADIEATRADVGDSVDALAAKADVKARAGDKAAAARRRVRDTAQRANRTVRSRPGPAAGVAAAVVTIVSVMVIRRRRPPMQAPTRNRLRWPR